jgi:DNA-binding transcriptional MocR family regulator
MTGPLLSLSARALAGLLPDLSELPGPFYLALADTVTALVRDGRIAPDSRLPSERSLAQTLRLSRATVTAAYDQLRERGVLVSRTGAGSFVTLPVTPGRRSDFARWSMSDPSTIIDMSCAALAAPEGILTTALASAAGQLSELATGDGYNPTGLPQLRDAIAQRFSARGVPTAPEQIMITNGALHAFDLLLRLLTGPGDRVITELPSYPGAFDAIRANSARAVPVPMALSGGWDVAQLQAALRQSSPRLAYLIPDFHNPTGILIDEAARRDVFRAARQTGTAVIVDESFVDIGFTAAERASAAIDSTVITIGSLSKPVWGGLRIGWIRASADMVRRLAILRATTDLAGSALDQLVATALFPRMDEIAALRRTELLPCRDALLAALGRQLPGWRWAVPAGGLSVWVELDAPLATPLSLLAAQSGLHIVPGSRFGVDGTMERFIRLPFALPIDQLEEAVTRLADAWAALDRSRPAERPLVVA